MGDLTLSSEIYPNSRGIVTKSCNGKLTGNVLFGKAGVGKSTIASWISTSPGLFDVGTAKGFQKKNKVHLNKNKYYNNQGLVTS